MARTGRVTLAAEELCVTHSAVSRQVKALERTLGVRLFAGPKHRLELTPAGRDLMGELTQAFDQITAVMSMVQSGKLRALGVASLERNPALPNVPAINEVLPGFEATAWVGIFAPAKTPRDVVLKVQAETRRIFGLPEIQQRMRELGATPVASSPQDFATFVRKDTEKWRNLVRSANISVQ